MSGVDRNSHVQRILVRFKATDDAVRAGKAIVESFPLVMERSPAQKEDIEVTTSLLISTRTIIPFLFLVVFWEFWSSIALLFSGLTILGVVLLGLVFLLPILFFWLTLIMLRRPVKKLLRFVEDSVMLVDGNGEQELEPGKIEWKTSMSFVLGEKIYRTNTLVAFASSSDAARAVQLIRDRFPELGQTNIGY